MLYILIGFVILAALQWFLIRRIPWRFVRVLVQVPLLVLTVFGALFLLQMQSVEEGRLAAQAVEDSVLDSSFVITGDLVVSVGATGSITPQRQVSLNFGLASAPVNIINIQAGETVLEGQIIAELDNTDIAQTVADTQIALDLQRSSFTALTSPPRPEDLAAAQAALDAANAQVNSAFATGTSAEEREIARLQAEIARNQLWQAQIGRDGIVDNPPEPISLAGTGVAAIPDPIDDLIEGVVNSQNAASQSAYDSQSRQAEATVGQAEYGVEIADANYTSTSQRYADAGALASANAGLVQAQVAYDRLINGPNELQVQQAAADLRVAELNLAQAELNLEQTQLIAPFSGIVAQINLTVGELPSQGISVLLIDNSSYYVDLPIDETDIASIAIGQVVSFEVDALPNSPITGVVSSISYAPIQSQEVNLVAYNVRVQVDATNTAIRAGMTVTGNIITLERQDVLLVRNNFIRIDRRTGDAFVTVRAADGSFEERLILLGERNDSYSEVLAGLEEGEELILLPRLETELGG